MNETFYSRWGDPVEDDRDYAHIPGYILRNCANAGIEPNELAFITQAISFKYDVRDSESRPSLATLGERLGRTGGTIRRLRDKLVKKGLLIVIERSTQGPEGYPDLPSILDFSPLREKCLELDKEYQESLRQRGMADSPGGGGKNATGGVAKTPPKELEVQESEDKNSKTLACSSNNSGESILPLTEDIEVEKPKRKNRKKSPSPPKKKTSWERVIGFYSFKFQPDQPFDKETEARTGRILGAISSARFDPLLSVDDLANAYEFYVENKPDGFDCPGSGSKVIAQVINPWLDAGKPDMDVARRYEIVDGRMRRVEHYRERNCHPDDYMPEEDWNREPEVIDYDEPVLCPLGRVAHFGLMGLAPVFYTERELREKYNYGSQSGYKKSDRQLELEEKYIRELLESQREHIASDVFQEFQAKTRAKAAEGDENAQSWVDRFEDYLARKNDKGE